MGEQNRRTTILDEGGCAFQIGLLEPDCSQRLFEMYEYFSPKNVSQGLPPEGESRRREWVDFLLSRGLNFMLWQDDRPVGHAALVTDEQRKDAEYLIFICEGFRGRGLGTALTRMVMERARQMSLLFVWLTVEGYNFRAIRLYKKFGFIFNDEGGWERIMILRLGEGE